MRFARTMLPFGYSSAILSPDIVIAMSAPFIGEIIFSQSCKLTETTKSLSEPPCADMGSKGTRVNSISLKPAKDGSVANIEPSPVNKNDLLKPNTSDHFSADFFPNLLFSASKALIYVFETPSLLAISICEIP